jgi:hypothetical protein
VSAARIALWWVDRYTRGVPDCLRDERRAELASDLWEHRAASGRGARVELAVLSRCLRGVPADLAWRRSRRGRRPLPSRGAVARFAGWSVGALGYLFLVGVPGYSATALVGLDLYGGDWEAGDVAAYARVGAVLLALLLAGAALLRPFPRIAVALLAAATLAPCVVYWWAAPVYGPVGLVVVAAAVGLARRRRQRASSAAS